MPIGRRSRQTHLSGEDARSHPLLAATGTEAFDELGRMLAGLVHGALRRSMTSPSGRDATHFDPVWRLTPTARAAAVIVHPERIRSASRAPVWRPPRVRMGMRAPPDRGVDNQQPRALSL
jgi:hypothetical protein